MLGDDSSVRLTAGQGGIASGLRSVFKQQDTLWIGWPGVFTNDEREKSKIRSRLATEQQHPVFLSRNEIEHFYHGFCNETLWPNFHYFHQYTEYRLKDWRIYCAVNAKYAQEILKVAQPTDTFWVHDYQLLLLPQLLRESWPDATIGFFLHIPFPELSSFSRLPWRTELLRGMLGADCLGFHTYDDVQNFLSNVYRLLGISHLNDTLRFQQRVLRVECMPMGIDYKKYAETAQLPHVIENEIRLKNYFGNEQKHVLSIDRLDYTKGIPQRLRAFEALLDRYPRYRKKVSMVLIVVPSREEIPYYKQLKQVIDLLVGQINGKYATMTWQPIRYFYRSFPLNWLSTFYRLCDVAFISPLIDGMNLVCKEFIASRKDTGVLILSEMAGSSKELYEALRVNPHDSEDLLQKLRTALSMSKTEQQQRLKGMQSVLSKHDVQNWVYLFTKHLRESKQEQEKFKTQYLNPKEQKKLCQHFQKAQCRLLFLDYDGTLVDFFAHPERSSPDAALLQLLATLSLHKKNRVVIISGRDRRDIDKWLAHLPLYLVAEHGAWTKNPDEDWQTTTNIDNSWKKDIRLILEEFVSRTPGSFIEEKHFSLTWHFRNVDPHFGKLRAWALVNHLRYILSRMNLVIMEGNKVIEVKNPEVNKGKAAQKYLTQHDPDLVLGFGDDQTDEDTFKALPEGGYSIKVGADSSAARYWVEDYKEVRQLLEQFTKNQ